MKTSLMFILLILTSNAFAYSSITCKSLDGNTVIESSHLMNKNSITFKKNGSVLKGVFYSDDSSLGSPELIEFLKTSKDMRKFIVQIPGSIYKTSKEGVVFDIQDNKAQILSEIGQKNSQPECSTDSKTTKFKQVFQVVDFKGQDVLQAAFVCENRSWMASCD